MRALSWRLTLRVIAALFWIISIIWFITEPGFEPLLTLLGGTASFLGSFAVSDAPIGQAVADSQSDTRRSRNRHAMLELVRNSWVKGVLEQSLHGAVLIELGMEERAGAVERPWDMVLQVPDQPNRSIPHGTKIVDVFDETSKALLILGAPGSGKTTMLLELARDTIARAEEDPTQPIPVVFNLSSWAEKRQPIAEWLVDELSTKYNIPKKIARPWVENDELLLLLDGLDEVKPERREDCVRAINDFRLEHMMPLAICSRVADYETLTTRLKLQRAILLQPLTSKQVTEYLDRAGDELSAVRRMYYDVKFQELVQSPLMLSVMTLAYRGMSVEGLGALDTIEARRRHLFDAYVRGMFERRGKDHPWPPDQIMRYLAWLAQEMVRHSQTMFLIERMQPSWLLTDVQRHLYRGIVALTLFLIVGLVVGLFVGLGGGLVGGLGGVLAGALVGGLAGWFTREIKPVEVLKLKWPGYDLKEFLNGVLFGGRFGVLVGALVGVLFGVLFGGLVGGLVVGLGGGLVGVVFGVVFGGLFGVLSSAEIEMRTTPNQGIWQSAKNAIIVGLFGVLVGVLFGVLGGELVNVPGGVLVGVLVGVLFGGGLAFIQHFVLRLILYRKGYLPWKLVRFLDYAAERIFLRKVGGGYIFIHRLLQDYFASLEAETATP